MLTNHKIVRLLFFVFLLVAGFDSNSQPGGLSQQVSLQTSDDELVEKYATLLRAPKQEIAKFRSLYSFIDKWMGTPYLWGGCSSKGIDCSCFILTLFNDVYDIKIQRTSFTQFYDNDISLFKSKKQYSTGDLIFFKTNINRETRKNRVTHVGLYLTNGFFVQSSSKGVNIANLESGYWKTATVAAGRLKESFYQQAGMRVPEGLVETTNKLYIAEEDSDFSPPGIPEYYDSIVSKYSKRLEIPAEQIDIPELLVHLDSLEQIPRLFQSCETGASASSCLIATLYKRVFDVNVSARGIRYLADSTIDILQLKDSLSVGDLVYFKTNPKLKSFDQVGIYLYNNYIAYSFNNQIIVSSLLKDPKLKVYRKLRTRLSESILKKAGENLMQSRKEYESLHPKIKPNTSNEQILVDTVQKQNMATPVLEPVSLVKAIQPFSKSLADCVPGVIIPYQETPGETYPGIISRYAKQLNVHPIHFKNSLLYFFADNWQNTPYKKKGCSRKQVNHECFMVRYFAEVYDRNIVLNQLLDLNGVYATPLNENVDLKEGDILFFGTKMASDVKVEFTGIYLNGKYFLSLSPYTQKVSICKIDDDFYSRTFLSAARPIEKVQPLK